MEPKQKIKIMILPILVILLLSGCGRKQAEQENQDMKHTDNSYEHITQEEARNIMDTDSDAIILDVRTQKEYDAGHIKNAILIPNNQISDDAEQKLPDKEQTILVYCRSGNRSRQAAEALAELGYTDIREFGGIMTWPYDIEMP